MWLSVDSSTNTVDEDVVVKDGSFSSAALSLEVHNPSYRATMASWPDAESLKYLRTAFPAGVHKIFLTAYFNGAWQDASVLSLTGDGGKALRGKLFKVSDPDVTDSDKTLDAKFSIVFPAIPKEVEAIELVKHARLIVPGEGRSATDVESNVKLFLNSGNGLGVGSGWSAKQQASDVYEVSYDYINGSVGEDKAIWSANIATKQVKYVNSNGKIFSWSSDQ